MHVCWPINPKQKKIAALKESKGKPGSLKMECLSSSPRKVFANSKSPYMQNLTDIGYSSVTFRRWKSLIKSVHAKKTRPTDLGAHTPLIWKNINVFLTSIAHFYENIVYYTQMEQWVMLVVYDLMMVDTKNCDRFSQTPEIRVKDVLILVM